MKKKIMTKWVKALRSNKYKQGKDLLCTDDNKFCCLGVLCDLYQNEAKRNKKAQLNSLIDKKIGCVVYGGEMRFLPNKVMDWAGLNTDKGVTSHIKRSAPYSKCTSLANMNDCGLTFETIANFIEEHYESL